MMTMAAQPGGRHRAASRGPALLEPPGETPAPPSGQASGRIVVHARGPLAAVADEVDEPGRAGSLEGLAADGFDGTLSPSPGPAGDGRPLAGPEHGGRSDGRAIGAQGDGRIPGRRLPVPDTRSLLIAPSVPGPGMRPHAERAAWYLSAAGIAGWDEVTPVRRRTSESAHPAAATAATAATAEAAEQVPAVPRRTRSARTARWLEDLTPGGLDQLLGEPATRAQCVGGRMPRDLPDGSAPPPGGEIRRRTVPRPDPATAAERVPSGERPAVVGRRAPAVPVPWAEPVAWAEPEPLTRRSRRVSVAQSRRAEQVKARRRHRRRSWQQEMGAQAWQRAVAGSALMAVSGALGLAAMQHSVALPSWDSEARPPSGATAAQPLFAPLAVVAEQPLGSGPLDVPLSESAAGRIAGAGTFFAEGSFLGTGSAGKHAMTPQIQAAKDYARSRMASFGWTDPNELVSLDRLWTRESGWQVDATNPKSGAYGIPQSLPASKLATAGADWRTNYRTQIEWGLNYIKDRYGSPAKAWAHSQSTGWY